MLVKSWLLYLEDLDSATIEQLRAEGYLVGDPGKGNLLYILSSSGHRLRFTGRERRRAIRVTDFNTKILNFRRKSELKGQSIETIERPLSGVNGKSCQLEEFKKYLKVKNEINRALADIYNSEIFRKLRWYGYINRERYYSTVIKRVKNMMENEKKTVLIYGDYGGKTHLKGTVPTPGVGLKRRISQEVKVVNLDEFRTSALSFHKEEYCEKLEVVKDGKWQMVHSILTYKTDSGRTDR